MEGAPAEERIRIFLRLRPVARPTSRVVVGAAEEPPWVEFHTPRNPNEGLINNSRENFRFPFDGLLPPDVEQAEVFDRVALPVLRAALDGYNGTVFAFGQTGSGKTFTITGGAERYADRGLIPRALAALFTEAAARPDHTFNVHVSYMEIYNEQGFDLLSPEREVRALEDLPKVHFMEDEEGRTHPRGLSLHRCDNEEQALNMLFLGDTNRVVAETPLNQASSRSHCVFTLNIEARRAGEPLVRRSKLHFVDLAGSERTAKTGLVAHTQLKEAKYINLSLHFLEQVIISLQEGRGHVPYRNSVLTMVLRDSLGGNCRTVMVAAVAPEAAHVEESISTCRFAQRVAMVSNKVAVNEEIDPDVLIRKLKAENTLLRQEVALLRGGFGSSDGGGAGGGREGDGGEAGSGDGGAAGGVEASSGLSEGEQHALRRRVAAYLDDPSPDAVLTVEPSMFFIQAAFNQLKSLVKGGGGGSTSQQAGGASAPAADAELRSLRLLVQQQEQQIAVLAGVLRKQGLAAPTGGSAGTARGAGSSRRGSGSSSGSGSNSVANTAVAPAVPAPSSRPSSSWGFQQGQQTQQLALQPPRPSTSAGGRAHSAGTTKGPTPAYSDDVLADQHKAFEFFCTTSPAHDAVAEHKAVLRGQYEAARALGAAVSASKKRLSELKAAVEARRLARSMAALMRQQQGGGSAEEEEEAERQAAEAEEERAKAHIEQEKAVYRDAYGQLRGVKAEIDGVQAALEHARARLQHDFQAWYAAMAGSGGGGGGAGSSADCGGGSAVQARPAERQEQQPSWSGGAPSPATVAQDVRPSTYSSARASSPAAPASAALPSFASWHAAPSFHFDQQEGGSSSASPRVQQQQQVWPAAAAAPGSPAALQHHQLPSYEQQGQVQLQTLTQVHVQQLQQAPPPPPPQQQQQPPDDPYADVEADVLAAARPLLTGDLQADADIIKFYQARAALLKGVR